MKKPLITIFLAAGVFLGGCSLVEEASNTVTYVNDAVNYMNEANDFVNEVPPIVTDAVTDQQKLAELETRLEEMKEEIQAFNELQPPEIAADLHQQMVDYNQNTEEGIDLVLSQIENGTLDPAVLENTEIYQSLEEISSIVAQIKQLGQ